MFEYPCHCRGIARCRIQFGRHCELLSRNRHPRRKHPPLTALTLFDSQLKKAGYTARDFRSAGFEARMLSEPWFWKDEGYTSACELEWSFCCAFFDARELKEAGYSARELRDAYFGVSDLEEAGFSVIELKSLGMEV